MLRVGIRAQPQTLEPEDFGLRMTKAFSSIVAKSPGFLEITEKCKPTTELKTRKRKPEPETQQPRLRMCERERRNPTFYVLFPQPRV